MQPQSTPPLNGQDIDRETFRRVWERVMPGSASPIAVDSPGGGEDGERALPTSSGPAREEAAAAQTRTPVPRCPSEEQRPPVPSCGPEEQPPFVPSCGPEPSLSYVPSCGPCRPCGASRTGQPPAPPAEDSGAGLRLLEEAVAEIFPAGDPGETGSLLTDRRQEDAARRALDAVRRALEALEAGMTPDAVLTDGEEALDALGELTGRTAKEEIVSRIFSRFCVGK